MKPESLLWVRCRVDAPETRMPPAIAIAARVRLGVRTDNSSNATSFNISLVVSASSVNNRVLFIE
ncbi:MAG: hypothetical protein DMF08_06425 [Verrucomicrobia bacterium]|nr:MAG: hypothetical protein DMF08_06425 [Verrucomicrobiota bacterium]PYL48711.1 MAG: hypothetical protein DMF32_08765 [Verrucomicrobiota bacterium]